MRTPRWERRQDCRALANASGARVAGADKPYEAPLLKPRHRVVMGARESPHADDSDS